MYYYEVAPLKIIRAGVDTFIYDSDVSYSVGQIVVVPVGKRTAIGVIVAITDQPGFTTKTILELIVDQALPPHLVKLVLWMGQYYAAPLASVLQTILPRGISKKRRAKIIPIPKFSRKRTNFLLNDDQQKAITAIQKMDPGTALLHGVTGSGKTVVYIELIRSTLASGASAIVLVPEISLTSQFVAELSRHFQAIILTHSRQTEAERHLIWQQALTTTKPLVIVGPRSALFLPVINPKLIIIDECHEPSFQQEQSPRYSTLRVAAVLASECKAKLVLGSATPLVSDYYTAVTTGRPIIELPKRADRLAVAPTITLIDMTKRGSFTRHYFLSNELLGTLESCFENGNQALIFHNRRGTATTTLCSSCGWQALCPRCLTPYVLHADTHRLRCHICARQEKVPTSCPVCHGTDIIHKGIGTKLIESELRKLFPDKKIVRFDGDSKNDSTVDKLYQQLYDGEIDLIIGTQTIAKGLDLPHLRVVGVVQADAGLNLPDFSSPERTFQLLSQVIGRVGRNHHPTSVVIQSYQPDHYAVRYGIAQDYLEFYTHTLPIRKRSGFPPYRFIMLLTCSFKQEATAIRHAWELMDVLRRLGKEIEILGPAPAFYERSRDNYRWQLVIKSPSRATLLALVPHVPLHHWQITFDPNSLL